MNPRESIQDRHPLAEVDVAHAEARSRSRWFLHFPATNWGGHAVAAVVAATAFALAAYHGTYGVEERSALALAVWWIVLAGIVFGAWPRASVRLAALLATMLLLAFAIVSGLSGMWGDSAENAFGEANRVMLYLGVVALTVLAAKRRTAASWSDGLAFATAAVAAVALLSRLFEGLFSQGPLPTFLPYAHTRLSFPVDYWNGLAILVALGVPLLLRVALASRSMLAHALALVPLPIIACVIYLASSRTGAITALVGTAGLLALTDRRWAAAGVVAAAVLGSTLAIAWLVHEHELVNGPLDSDTAKSQGIRTAFVVLAASTLATALYTVGSRVLPRYVRPSPRAGYLTVTVLGVAVMVAVASAHPVRRFEEFKRPPQALAASQYIRNHFLSTNGNWRWQYWTASVHEFRHRPVGGGAGSFEAWWAEHGTTVGFVRNAHSLYFEVLGELGIPGLLALLAAFAVAVAAGTRRALRAAPRDRLTTAAVTSAFIAFVVAVGVDWMWQLTAVAVVGMVLLGLCVGPATDVADEGSPRRRLGSGGRAVVASVAVVVLAAEALLLSVDMKISNSQAAARRGDLTTAAAAARSARRLEPWASTPYLQLGLVEEQAGQLQTARRSIARAIDRNRRDWRLWLVAARIESKLGDVPSARFSLHRAIELNPRSPIFANARNPG